MAIDLFCYLRLGPEEGASRVDALRLNRAADSHIGPLRETTAASKGIAVEHGLDAHSLFMARWSKQPGMTTREAAV